MDKLFINIYKYFKRHHNGFIISLFGSIFLLMFLASNIKFDGVYNSGQITKYAIITSSLTLAAVIGFLLITYKNKRSILLILMPLAYGALFSLSVIWIIKGSVSIVVLGASSAIIGIAMSYSIYLLSHQNRVRSVEQLLYEIANPLIVGSLTVILAFLGLLFTSSNFLQDFGLLVALMLIGAMIFCLMFLPQFLSIQVDTKESCSLKVIDKITSYQYDRNVLLIIFLSVVFIICCFASTKIQINDSDFWSLTETELMVESSGDVVNNSYSGIKDFNLAIILTSLLVFIVLLIYYGRLELSLMCFLPLIVSWIIVVGLMAIFGINLNIFCVFLFSVGSSISIFILDGLLSKYNTGRELINPYKSEIFFAIIPIVVGLGMLMHTLEIGFLILGILLIVLTSYILEPLLFRIFITNPTSKGFPPYTIGTFLKGTRKNNNSDLRQSIIQNYIYKGSKIERYVRRKKDYSLYDNLLPKQGKIVDIGCGIGVLDYMLSLYSPDREVLGIDYDVEKIAIADNGYLKKACPNLRFVSSNVSYYNLPESNAFVINNVLHNLTDFQQGRLISHCAERLLPEGMILIQDADGNESKIRTFATDCGLNIRTLSNSIPSYILQKGGGIRLSPYSSNSKRDGFCLL